MFLGIISYKILIFLCAMLFIAGFVDSIAGGGGCISLPAYMLSGIPIQTAFGCNKVSACLGTTLASVKYFKAGAMNFKIALISAVFGCLSSTAASEIAVHMDADVFKKIIICVMPFAIIFLLIKRDFGTIDDSESIPARKAVLVSALAGIILGFYDGLIGPGTGTFAIMIFSGILKFDLKTASGNAKLLNWATGVGSVIAFVSAGKVIWSIALLTAASNMAGSYIGSSMALKKDPKFIRIMMSAVALLILFKLEFDMFAGE